MINKKFNLIIIFLSVFALVFFAAANSADAKVENSVSATANTGGNKIEGGGSITTGDAKATVNAKNYVNGGESAQNKVSAQAEGAKATVSVNGEEKSCTADDGQSCSVEIGNGDNGIKGSNGDNALNGENGSNGIEGDNELNGSEGNEGEKNIVQTVASAISSFTKSVTDKIMSWFS